MDTTIAAALIGIAGAIAAALVPVLLKSWRKRTKAPKPRPSEDGLPDDRRARPPQDEAWIEELAITPESFSALQSIRIIRDTCFESMRLYAGNPHYSPSLATHSAFEKAIAQLAEYVKGGFPFPPYLPPTFGAAYELTNRVLEFMKRKVATEKEGKEGR